MVNLPENIDDFLGTLPPKEKKRFIQDLKSTKRFLANLVKGPSVEENRTKMVSMHAWRQRNETMLADQYQKLLNG
jgi:hypothetical protein